MKSAIPEFLLAAPRSPEHVGGSVLALRFLEKILLLFSGIMHDVVMEWRVASRRGFLQKISPVVKILFFSAFLILVSVKQTLVFQGSAAFLLLCLVMVSRLPLWPLYKRVLGVAVLFGLVVPLPVMITRDWQWGLLLFGRVANSSAAVFVLLFSTSFPTILTGLSDLKVPPAMLFVLSLTRQWIFDFAKIIQDMVLAKKSRTVGLAPGRKLRVWLADRLGDVFLRTQHRSDDVWRAMKSRTLSESYVFFPHTPSKGFFCWRSWVLYVAGIAAIFV